MTVNYAKKQQGRRLYQAQSSHLPLKLNMAGVIPPIFASSIILFPATMASWSGQSEGMEWLSDIAAKISPGQPIYIILFAVAIIFFCFFYTALQFNARDTADNLKRSGAFITGIRPGLQTAKYIDKIMGRLTLIGALYITFVSIMPMLFSSVWHVPFNLGGTSLLIVVVVVMDFVSQIQSRLMSTKYDNLLKKSRLKKY
ncbi:MAG: hypothetical protein COC15_01625 [Legionellales bacterium]|nr:MAG: hypothetical protein COC15_01625 [Legionellales bacterium]